MKRNLNIWASILRKGSNEVNRYGEDNEVTGGVSLNMGDGGVSEASVSVRETQPGRYVFAAWRADSGQPPALLAEWIITIPHRSAS